MSLLKKLASLLGLAKAGTWATNELTKGLNEAEVAAAKVFGSDVGQFVITAATWIDPATNAAISDAEKLFKVAKDTVAAAAEIGVTMPFAVAIRLAQNAYEQIEKDAETVVAELKTFVADLKAKVDVIG